MLADHAVQNGIDMVQEGIDAFLEEVDAKICNRGRDLYDGGAVERCEEIGKGTWEGRVLGTRTYTVQFEQDRFSGEVLDWNCTCPYDWGPVCKHVIAMALEIREKKEGVSEDDDRGEVLLATEGFPEEVESLLKGVPRKNILKFLIDHLPQFPDLQETFRLYFAAQSPEKKQPDYAKMLDRAIKRAEKAGEWGFIEESIVEDILLKLDKEANRRIREGNQKAGIQLSLLILQKILPLREWIAHDSFHLMGEVQTSLERIGEQIQYDMVPDLRIELFEDLSLLFSKIDLDSWGIEDEFWKVMAELASLPNQYAKLLKIIEQEILKARDSVYAWNLKEWVVRKQSLYQKMGREQEAADFEAEYMDIPEFRQRFVDREISARRYYKAKKLIREGLKIAHANREVRTVTEWRSQLLKIAQLEGDVMDARVHARELFGDGDMGFYNTLKSTFSEQEWKKEIEKIIARLVEKGGAWATLAEIYKKEKMHKRLLSLLRSNRIIYALIKPYIAPLLPQYEAEIIALLKADILHLAEARTGRSAYRELTGRMKFLRKTSGSDTELKSLLEEIKVSYPRRPAMQDELKKAFPKLY